MQFYNKFSLSIVRKINVKLLLSLMVLLFTAVSCDKELKAGDPIALVYDNVYMIGDATPAAWNINDAIALTKSSDNEFTWTGPLKAGEIKFPTAKSWSSDTFGPQAAGQVVTDNKARLLPSGNPDLKWKLTSADAGNYKITLNSQNLTVTFQKL